jgi:uncharacterized membrane protein YgcG
MDQAHDKLSGSDEPEAPDTSTDTDSTGSDTGKTESVKDKELAATKHKLAVRELADELGVRGDKVLLETAEKLPDLTAARKLLEREKARGGSPRSSGFGGSAGGGGGTGGGKAPADAKEFAASIKD